MALGGTDPLCRWRPVPVFRETRPFGHLASGEIDQLLTVFGSACPHRTGSNSTHLALVLELGVHDTLSRSADPRTQETRTQRSQLRKFAFAFAFAFASAPQMKHDSVGGL